MKKILPYLLLVLVMAGIVSSCQKDEDEEPQAAEKWFIEKAVYEEYNAAGVIVDTETETNWTVNDYLSLQPDGKFELAQDGLKINGTYKIENSVMTLTFQETTSSTTISVTTTATVVEKSSSKFIFYVEEADSTGKIRSTLYFKK